MGPMAPLAKLPPPLVWLVSLGGAALATWFAAPLQRVWFRAPWLAAGVAVATLAGMGWATREFRRRRTTILPLRRPTSLLCHGPFRFSRNPLYLGMAVLALVPWLAWGQLGLLLAPAPFIMFVNAVVIPHEEAKLRELFGPDYAAYCRRVRRWL